MTSLFEKPVGFARIAVERGIDRYPDGLTYGVSADVGQLAPGERVIVPLGRGNTATPGYVIEILDTAEALESGIDPDALKLVLQRDEGAPLPGELLQLARWIASYYCAPIGVVLAALLPAAVKRRVGQVTRTLVDLAAPTPPLENATEDAADTPVRRTSPKQRAVIETLEGLDPGARPVDIKHLAELAGLATTTPIKRLIDQGRLTAVHRTTVQAVWAAEAADEPPPPEPTGDQRKVIDAVADRLDTGFSAHLLFGVTGSGKTEVYIRLIRQVLDRGKTALMLVPEISLTPQTGGRLIHRFPDQRVAILHSALSAARRHQQWALVADGTARIVLGARSAGFAPIPDGTLGLVIVDEEHDGSYKQDQAPRYHGRDVAVRRAQIARCPIMLGSATPSLETWHNTCHRSLFSLHRLDHRAPGLRVPSVRIVDFAEERRKHHDRRVHLLGPVLEAALDRALTADGQAMLLLNRRGYANYITCPDRMCGWVMTCDDCDVTVVYHKRDLPTGGPRGRQGYVQCHHCRMEQRLPETCPQCGCRVNTFGLGTQRVEEELRRRFPALQADGAIVRVDSDTMRSARMFHDVLGRFGAGAIRVLVGTQMIAKGHDFPGVQVVGVINADTSLNMPDFRAAERTFQLVSQVAGRCGRGTEPGVVIVQTFNPDAAAVRLAAAHDYVGFATGELAERIRCGLPPATRLVRIVARHTDHRRAVELASTLAAALRARATDDVSIQGPAPCPITRLAGRHRQQIEIMAPDAVTLQRLLTTARNDGVLRPGADIAVDVDPIDLM